MRIRLTEKYCRETENRPKDFVYWDEVITGLELCVCASGRRAFIFAYRFDARLRRFTIGSWPDWTVVAARDRVKDLKRHIDQGLDPMAKGERTRTAPRIAELTDHYIEEHLPRLAPRNADDQKAMIAKLILPDWKNRRVDKITPADLARLLDCIAAGRASPAKDTKRKRKKPLSGAKPTPIRANRVGEVLRKMFALSVVWCMRSDDPATGFR